MSEARLAAEPGRQKFRGDHKVRLIEKKDEGTGISKVPAGFYGFTYAPGSESPLFAQHAVQSFEIHKTAQGELFVLGFLTKGEVADMQSGAKTLDVKLYPDPYQDSTELVCLSFERLSPKARQPTRDNGNALPIMIYPEN
jgi:hypothetical protein